MAFLMVKEVDRSPNTTTTSTPPPFGGAPARVSGGGSNARWMSLCISRIVLVFILFYLCRCSSSSCGLSTDLVLSSFIYLLLVYVFHFLYYIYDISTFFIILKKEDKKQT